MDKKKIREEAIKEYGKLLYPIYGDRILTEIGLRKKIEKIFLDGLQDNLFSSEEEKEKLVPQDE